MESERDRARVSWADRVYGLERGWQILYERVRAARRRSTVLSIVLALPALGHRVCTGLARRLVFLSAHPIICCRRPWLLLRLSRGRVRSVLLQGTGLSSLADVVQGFQEAGLRPFLVFGTLLGYCREGWFIGHDRDIDLGVTDADEAALGRVKVAMAARGWALKRDKGGLVSFVKPFSRSVAVDLFVFRIRDEQAVCMRDGGASSRRLEYVYPARAVQGLRQVMFGGKVPVCIPERAEEFLDVSYGDWRVLRLDWHYLHDAPNLRITGTERESERRGPSGQGAAAGSEPGRMEADLSS